MTRQEGESSMGYERRHERFYLSYYLKVIDRETNQTIGHCANISNGGMMLISEEPIKTQKVFFFKMVFPEEIMGSRDFQFVAASKWCKKDDNPAFHNTGFQLEKISPENTQVIKGLIRKFCSVE